MRGDIKVRANRREERCFAQHADGRLPRKYRCPEGKLLGKSPMIRMPVTNHHTDDVRGTRRQSRHVGQCQIVIQGAIQWSADVQNEPCATCFQLHTRATDFGRPAMNANTEWPIPLNHAPPIDKPPRYFNGGSGMRNRSLSVSDDALLGRTARSRDAEDAHGFEA